MFYDNISGLVRVLVVSPLAYLWLILVLRISGKRTLAELNALDFIVTVALESTLRQPSPRLLPRPQGLPARHPATESSTAPRS